MRSCNTLGSSIFCGGLLALLTMGCGHAISVGVSGSGNSSSQGGTSNGGSAPTSNCTQEDLVTYIEAADAGLSAAGASGSGTCSALKMPCDASRPGYQGLSSADQATVTSLLSSMSSQNLIDQMYGVPVPQNMGDNSIYRDIERSTDVTTSDGRTIRGFEYRDADRGVNLVAGQHPNRNVAEGSNNNYSTAFPPPSTRSASWDVDLETRVGEAIGDEVMASLNNVLLAPCMNLLRHPYWGRSQETYGEDVYQVGRMASAMTVGIQKHVISCAKHYAANNIENNRSQQDVEMDEQTERELFTRHFGMVVQEGGAGCVMAAYNSINGVKDPNNQGKCTQNKHLLRDILKGGASTGGYGFQGFVISDWWAMPGYNGVPSTTDAYSQAKQAVQAGLDDEVPWALHFSALGAVLQDDQNANSQEIYNDIKDAAQRVLQQKVKFHTWNGSNSSTNPLDYGLGTPTSQLAADSNTSGSLATNTTHLALSEEADYKSKVLLTNGMGDATTQVLPIDTTKVQKIAVVGIQTQVNVRTDNGTEPPATGTTLDFSTDVNIGDRGSSRINADPATTIGPFKGIHDVAVKHGLADAAITHGNDPSDVQGADLAVVVVGLTAGDEGEEYSLVSFGDRSSLDLPSSQADFVSSVLQYNIPTVIIIESGSIVNVPWLTDNNQKQATIYAGYGGNLMGQAYGELLFGDHNFSGKMPTTWPSQAQLDANITFHASSGFTTTEDYWFGYRLYDHNSVTPTFPFGAGMSYATYQYSNLQVPCGSISKANVVDTSTGVVNVTVNVENTGAYDGDEIVMMFVQGPQNPAGITGKRPVKELKGFQRVSLTKASGGKSKARVTLPVSLWDLRHWEGDTSGSWVIDSGDYQIKVGPNAGTLPLTAKLTVQ